MHLETIKLFKALEITEKGNWISNREILSKTIKKGYIFSEDVLYNYSEKDLNDLIDEIDLNISPEEMNNTFHKSWNKIKNTDLQTLYLEQAIHYFTTYGFQALGIDSDYVFIPKEKLEIPELKDENIKLIVIKGYTKSELKLKVMNLLRKGIALKEDTLNSCMYILRSVGINELEISLVKNKEMKMRLYEEFTLYPTNNIEFLRYLIYITTGKSLLIKSKEVIEEIKSEILNEDKLGKVSLYLFNYKNTQGLYKLSEIFFRFKPLFLAFRNSSGLKPTINKIRKLANKHHKPMKEDILNSITNKIQNSKYIDLVNFEEKLREANIFRKIRLLQSIKHRLKANADASIMYKIRNGKSYVKDLSSIKNKADMLYIGKMIHISIILEVSKNVKGKVIYIPDDVKYALPTSEKQFVDNIPFGSCIEMKETPIVGINWKNVNSRAIDLDFSTISLEGKVGWDGKYRQGNVLFSGDSTTAFGENGSSEVFYMGIPDNTAYIFNNNYYNYRKDTPVPYKLFIAKTSNTLTYLNKNYIIDPNELIYTTKSILDKKQKLVGLLTKKEGISRFYFFDSILGKSRSATCGDLTSKTLNYLFNYYSNAISFNKLLEDAGAIITTNKEDCDIDLSLESLEKDTIINLLSAI